MKFTEFKNGIERNELDYSVYLFQGEDGYFREHGVKILTDKYVSEPTLNYVSYSGSEVETSELIASLSAYPFMSEKRLTVVREYYPKAEVIKGELLTFLTEKSQGGILAIANEKLTETFKKYSGVCVVDCGKAELNLLSKWVKNKCLSSGIDIDLETASELCSVCALDMTRIEIETEKLIAYALKDGIIKKGDIELLITRDSEYKIYEMTNYIAQKKFDSALTVIKDLMGKGETSQRIIVSIYNYFRKLLHFAISGKSVADIAKVFGMSEYPAKKTKEQSDKFKKKALKSAVDYLCDADYKIKSGQIDADEQMWMSVFKIMINC